MGYWSKKLKVKDDTSSEEIEQNHKEKKDKNEIVNVEFKDDQEHNVFKFIKYFLKKKFDHDIDSAEEKKHWVIIPRQYYKKLKPFLKV